MLFNLFNLKVKLQTEYFQESDEIKILTVESSCDWFEDSTLFEFWIIGSLYIVVGISKTIVSGEIIGDNRYIDVIFELWISNKLKMFKNWQTSTLSAHFSQMIYLNFSRNFDFWQDSRKTSYVRCFMNECHYNNVMSC